MSKKKYSLPQGISSEISNTVEVVKDNIGTLNYKIVPLDAIEFDPKNPRALAIAREDLPDGPSLTDPFYSKKIKEFEILKQTADTIKKYGIRNAVEIYKCGTKYRLIHGERRCLSSILAGKKNIPAKILDEKPNDFDIRLLQLIENVQREDLTLYETLNNVRLVIREYKNHIDKDIIVDAIFLEDLINRSKTHSLNLLAILNASNELNAAIKEGKINSLEKAAIIAKARTEFQKEFLMKICINGASLKELKQEAAQQKNQGKLSPTFGATKKKRPGKQPKKINLGSTKNKGVIAKLIHLVSDDPHYFKFRDQFNQILLEDFGVCAEAFTRLIRIMEKIENA